MKLLRKILTNGFKLNKNYGFEWNFFWKVRSFKDGITFIKPEISWDRYEWDHKPSFEIYLCIFNYTIIELRVYYLHHRLHYKPLEDEENF
jgi:hypothetical protein